MAQIPAKGRVIVTIEGHPAGKKFEYRTDDYYRPIKVDTVVSVLPENGEDATKELEASVKQKLKTDDYVIAKPFATHLSPGADFVLMDEKGKYELLLTGMFMPDNNNAYGELKVSDLKIIEKLSGPKKVWNYLKEL